MRTRRRGFVSAHAEAFGVQRICRVLRVSRWGYHRWIAGAKTRQERQAADDALLVEIREIHTEHKGTYGVRRVHAELRGFGHTVDRKRVERLMRVNRLEGRHLRRRKRTTVPDRLAPPASDLVQRDFTASRLDEKWCGDITPRPRRCCNDRLNPPDTARGPLRPTQGHPVDGRSRHQRDNAACESFHAYLKREPLRGAHDYGARPPVEGPSSPG